MHQGAGYHFGRISTKTNIIADGISQIPSEHALAHSFPILLAQAPRLNSCRRFLPNAVITSLIVDILLQNACMDPLTTSRPLLNTPGRFTSSPVDSYIKNRLRWRSNTFLMYLCNTFHMTEQHTMAITLGLDPPAPDATRPLKQHELRPGTGAVRLP